MKKLNALRWNHSAKAACLILIIGLTGCNDNSTVKDLKSLEAFASRYQGNTDVYLLVEQDVSKCNSMVDMGLKTTFLSSSSDVLARLKKLKVECDRLESKLNSFRDDTSKTLDGALIANIKANKPVDADVFATALENSTAKMDALVRAEANYLNSLKDVTDLLTDMTVRDLTKSQDFLKRAGEPQVQFLLSVIKAELRMGQGDAAADKLLELMAVLYSNE
ncbi:hypothetical protein RYA05_02685 [Pseudomonas syringae pv. actinidiae]|nr:hypothetical protein [Pseudomonas syringae pv. actinidiae]